MRRRDADETKPVTISATGFLAMEQMDKRFVLQTL